jgi:hypothetical protein
MPNRVRLYDDLDRFFVDKMQKALLTGDIVNMPDWVDDMAAWIAQWISDMPQEEQDRLRAYAHQRIDYHVQQKKG